MTCRTSSRKSAPSFTSRHPRAKVHKAVECHPARVNPGPRRNRVPVRSSKAKARDVTATLSMLSSKSSTKTRRSNEFAGDLSQDRSEEHTSELQSQSNLVCRLLLEKKKKKDQ